MMESFSQLGLAESLANALASFGFEEPTQVQKEAVPILLSRKDAIIESETGTGKTFAYLAPAFQLASTLDRKSSGEPGAIVAAPTQELAVQIGREAERLAKAAELPLKVVVLLGGTPIEKQVAKLKAKPDIIVGTLGRLADLVALGRIKTQALKLLVLDEADRLFAPETAELAEKLVKSAPATCVRAMVSATIPEKARRAMLPFLREPAEICPANDAVLSESIEHWCFYCDGRKRLDFVRRFEAAMHPERCLLFLSVAARVEKAALALDHFGLPIAAIHSGMDKEERRVALEQFVSGEVRYLLTSDLGARGLDIQGISHVISLDLPEEGTIYTHRAGRTGRAGANGVSIVLADAVELKRASKIATKGGFVFRCKVLEEGKVLEPTSEEFFARAEKAEEQRMEAKAAKLGEDEERGPRKAGPKMRGSREREGGERRKRDEGESSFGRGRRSDYSDRSRSSDDDRRYVKPSPDDPTEGPRTATAPKSAPWRPAAEGERPSRSGPTLPRLTKKSSIREEKPRREEPSSHEHARRREDEGAKPAYRGDRQGERPRREGRDESASRGGERRPRFSGEGRSEGYSKERKTGGAPRGGAERGFGDRRPSDRARRPASGERYSSDREHRSGLGDRSSDSRGPRAGGAGSGRRFSKDAPSSRGPRAGSSGDRPTRNGPRPDSKGPGARKRPPRA
jgi:Superfamily II DNA and RNA helicases